MTYAIDAPDEFAAFDSDRLNRRISPRLISGAAILAAVVTTGAWMIDAYSAYPSHIRLASATQPDTILSPQAPKPQPAPPVPPVVAVNAYSALFDPSYSLRFTRARFAPGPNAPDAPPASTFQPTDASDFAVVETPQSSDAPTVTAKLEEDLPPLASAPKTVDAAPTPIPRPPELRAAQAPLAPRAPRRQVARLTTTGATVVQQQPDNRNFLERLFGGSQGGGQQPAGPVLAYAPANGGILDAPQPRIAASPPAAVDRQTAIYDISARMVYMPSGARLEAHSGLGALLDDPRYVSTPNRGPTPPHLYDLTLREQLFHGVRALRLTPADGGSVYGRVGLLAHTFMLGPKGDSNGCVSFRDYNAFLQAFLNGEVKRLVVVARLGDRPI